MRGSYQYILVEKQFFPISLDAWLKPGIYGDKTMANKFMNKPIANAMMIHKKFQESTGIRQ